MKSERAKEIIESDMGYMTEGGLIFTDDAKNDDEYVVGWREIL